MTDIRNSASRAFFGAVCYGWGYGQGSHDLALGVSHFAVLLFLIALAEVVISFIRGRSEPKGE